MSNKKVEDYIEIGIGAWLIESLFKNRGPSKAEYEKAKRKRALCKEIYFERGKKYATFEQEGITWTEEIKEDPFRLY